MPPKNTTTILQDRNLTIAKSGGAFGRVYHLRQL